MNDSNYLGLPMGLPHNPNPRARKAYLTRNRMSNNVVARPGFRSADLGAPQPREPAGQATVCRCPANVFVAI